MELSYRKGLERVARQMNLIHRADIVIKLVLRTIVRDLKVRHAGIFVYDKKHDAYIAKVSRGNTGFKIPSGFVKIKKDNPIINYFTVKRFSFCGEFILLDNIEKSIRSVKMKNDIKAGEFLDDLKTNLDFYQARACVPGFFRKELVGVLFLGDKNNGDKFNAKDLGFLATLASDVVMAIKNAWLFEDLSRQIEVNKRLFLQMISAFVSSIEAKDKYTSGHTERVMKYALCIAEQLKKRGQLANRAKFIDDLRVAALLHDIGKIGVPENILNKPAALSEEERDIVREHPLIGENILKGVDELDMVRLGVKFHHERCDGFGYPSGLRGEAIPLIASVIGLADAYDAMTSDRPYRKALSSDEAINEIKKNKGKQFDPQVVDAFMDYIQEAGGNPI
jgi:HD-GYP domain-containing protein (c-di-GMP phosphodiesterase class II)